MEACICQTAIQKKNQKVSLTFGFWLQEPRKATVQSLGTVLSRLVGQKEQNLTRGLSRTPRATVLRTDLVGTGGNRGTEKSCGNRGGPGVGE